MIDLCPFERHWIFFLKVERILSDDSDLSVPIATRMKKELASLAELVVAKSKKLIDEILNYFLKNILNLYMF